MSSVGGAENWLTAPTPKKGGIQSIILNCIWWWGFGSGDWGVWGTYLLSWLPGPLWRALVIPVGFIKWLLQIIIK